MEQLAAQLPAPVFELAEGLETPIQTIYLTALLGFLSVGAYLVVRQVLIRNELEEAAKSLGERIRTGEASCEVSIAHRHRVRGAGAACGSMRARPLALLGSFRARGCRRRAHPGQQPMITAR
jgi:hypothetical protein